jgi:hypothetical protein
MAMPLDSASSPDTAALRSHRCPASCVSAWMVQTRCASTALNKHKALQQFVHLRDQAIIWLLYDTGAQLSEVANLNLEDVDLALDSVRFHGKGAKDRRLRIGPKTARGVSRYLRARSGHPGLFCPNLWLAVRGLSLCAANGIKLMLKRRGLRAGVDGGHAHRWRHSYAHEWKLAGGDTGDLMLPLGWTSEDMPRHYGASAAAEGHEAGGWVGELGTFVLLQHLLHRRRGRPADVGGRRDRAADRGGCRDRRGRRCGTRQPVGSARGVRSVRRRVGGGACHGWFGDRGRSTTAT